MALEIIKCAAPELVLLTGANGFIGSYLHKALDNNCVVASRDIDHKSKNKKQILFNDLLDETKSALVFTEVKQVVHLANLAHQKAFSAAELQKINVDLTLLLAKNAANNNVKRFIFISSIGVNGTSNSSSFNVRDEVNPTEDYAISKYKAEIGLKKIAEDTGMEIVIIRPTLVYGKNVPGNFGTLLKVAKKNLPLPLGAIYNQRSFVAVDNLIDLIVTCIDHPNAANQTFFVSDDENVSTSQLLKKLTLAAGKKPWLLPVPVSFLKFAASIFGKRAAVERFSSSLTVDIEHTKNTLNWKPPITLDEGIRRCFK